MVGWLTKLVTFFTTSLLVERQLVSFDFVHSCAQLGPNHNLNGTSNASQFLRRVKSPVKGPLEQGRKIYIAECTDRCVLEVHFIGDTQFVLGELERPHPDRKVQKNQQNVNSRSQAFHKCLRCCFVEVGESSKSAQRPNICCSPFLPSSKSQPFGKLEQLPI